MHSQGWWWWWLGHLMGGRFGLDVVGWDRFGLGSSCYCLPAVAILPYSPLPQLIPAFYTPAPTISPLHVWHVCLCGDRHLWACPSSFPCSLPLPHPMVVLGSVWHARQAFLAFCFLSYYLLLPFCLMGWWQTFCMLSVCDILLVGWWACLPTTWRPPQPLPTSYLLPIFCDDLLLHSLCGWLATSPSRQPTLPFPHTCPYLALPTLFLLACLPAFGLHGQFSYHTIPGSIWCPILQATCLSCS